MSGSKKNHFSAIRGSKFILESVEGKWPFKNLTAEVCLNCEALLLILPFREKSNLKILATSSKQP